MDSDKQMTVVERQRAQDAEQARLDAEKREVARRQEELLATDRMIEILRGRINGMPQYAGIAAAIDKYLAAVPNRMSKSQLKRHAARKGVSA